MTKKMRRAFWHPGSALVEESEHASTTRAELLRSADRRDAIGRLAVFPEENVDPRDIEVFGVLKKVARRGASSCAKSSTASVAA